MIYLICLSDLDHGVSDLSVIVMVATPGSQTVKRKVNNTGFARLEVVAVSGLCKKVWRNRRRVLISR